MSVLFKDPGITAAYRVLLDATIQGSGPMTVIVAPWDPAEPLASSPMTPGQRDVAGALLSLGIALQARGKSQRLAGRLIYAEIVAGSGAGFNDRVVQLAHVRLLDAIGSWERMTGGQFTTIMVPWHPPEPIMIATGGTPQAEHDVHDVITALGLALARRDRAGRANPA